MKLLLACTVVLAASASCAQTAPTPSFVTGTPQDEAAIRAIIKDLSADKPNAHVAPDVDWENAFGIRYFDLKKRDAFYHAVVSPLQKEDTDSTLEVKVRFPTADTAIADEYWHVVGQLDVETHKPGPDRWGRTTYFFTKHDGTWTEVLERVADLRLPYYKHYDTMPMAVPVPAATLASYAGTYELTADHSQRTIAVSGDHLTVASAKRTRVAIPTSATEFLLFSPADLAEYAKLRFEKDASGNVTGILTYETNEPMGTLKKK